MNVDQNGEIGWCLAHLAHTPAGQCVVARQSRALSNPPYPILLGPPYPNLLGLGLDLSSPPNLTWPTMPYPKLYLLGPSHVTWSILFDTCSPPNTTYIQLAPLSYLFKGNISLVERGLKRTNKFYSRHSLCLLPFLVLRLSLTLPSWSPCNLYQLTLYHCITHCNLYQHTWICTTVPLTGICTTHCNLYHCTTHCNLYQLTGICTKPLRASMYIVQCLVQCQVCTVHCVFAGECKMSEKYRLYSIV